MEQRNELHFENHGTTYMNSKILKLIMIWKNILIADEGKMAVQKFIN